MASAAEFDTQLAKLESALGKVQQAKGSKVKLPGAELNFLTIIEKVRDMMSAALVDRTDRDREKLIGVFGGDCARFAKLRAVLATIELSDMNARDQRLRMCLDVTNSVEQVLKEKGFEGKLQEAGASAIRHLTALGGPGPQPAAAAPAPPSPAPAPAAAPSSAAFGSAPILTPGAEAQSAILGQAPAPAALAVPTLSPPPKEQCIVVSEAEEFEVSDDVQRSIQVELTCETKPEVSFGPGGSIIAHVPSITVKISTTCTPAMPVVAGIAPVQGEKEVNVTIPAAEKIVFDPQRQLPAGGRFDATASIEVEVLEFPQTVDARVGSKSQSPWGSVKLKDSRGESEVHWEVALHGTFSLAQRGKANVLSITVDLELFSSLSGAASARYSQTGTPMLPPVRE